MSPLEDVWEALLRVGILICDQVKLVYVVPSFQGLELELFAESLLLV